MTAKNGNYLRECDGARNVKQPNPREPIIAGNVDGMYSDGYSNCLVEMDG